MIVVDASVVVIALADDNQEGDTVRERLRGESPAAPERIDVEVTSVLRRQEPTGALDDRRVRLALDDLIDIRMHRAPHRALLTRCWEPGHSPTVYDAAHGALAEALEVTPATGDRRLARANGPRCVVEVLPGAT